MIWTNERSPLWLEVLEVTGRRQEDLLAPAEVKTLAEARERLRRSSALLRSQSDLAVGRVREALEQIQAVLLHPSNHQVEEMEEKELLVGLDHLDEAVTGLEFDPAKVSVWRDSLETILTSVQPGSGAHCEVARLALQHLIEVRTEDRGGAALNTALENFLRASRDIRNLITAREKALVSPLELMISAAEAGDEAGVREAGARFSEHALQLVEVAELACSFRSSSQGGKGVEAVREAAAQLQSLHYQVEWSSLFTGLPPKAPYWRHFLSFALSLWH